jgi:hypothetical protein
MADEAAQDIEALNLRDKDRDDSERRDEVRGRRARFARHFFSNVCVCGFSRLECIRPQEGTRKRRIRVFSFSVKKTSDGFLTRG